MAVTYTREAKLASKARQAAKNRNDVSWSTAPVLPSAPSAPVAPAAPTAPALTAIPSPTSFPNLVNAVLPYLSPQDQQAASVFLNTQDPTGAYKDYLGQVPFIPQGIGFDAALGAETASEKTRERYLSSTRASEALAKLDAMRQQSGLTEEQLGSGYKFLKQVIGILKTLGGTEGERMTRAEFESMQSQLGALMSQAQSDKTLAPYAEVASKFINPTVVGQFNPVTQIAGRTVYGQANKKFFE